MAYVTAESLKERKACAMVVLSSLEGVEAGGEGEGEGAVVVRARVWSGVERVSRAVGTFRMPAGDR